MMKRFLARRALFAIITIIAIATATFILMKVIPGDPFQDEHFLPASSIELLRKFYGLNDPLYVQYFRHISSLFSFDFGPSLKFPGQSVTSIITDGFPISFVLGIEALLIAIPTGVFFGMMSALFPGKKTDKFTNSFVVLGISTPSFVCATVLQFLFAIYIPLLPIALWGGFSHTILPALSLALAPACMIAKLLRASFLEILNQQYIHNARARGLSNFYIFYVHILKNSCLPILNYLGPIITNILVGSFVVEKVFAIPGLGSWFITGVITRDYSVIGGLTLFYSIILLFNHTVIDCLNFLIDPRLRTQLNEGKIS